MRFRNFIMFFGAMIVGMLPPLSLVHGTDRVVVADFSMGLDGDGVPRGWKLHERSGKANLSIVKEGGMHAIHLRSSDTSFAIQKTVDVDPWLLPLLSWKWKVTKLPLGGDFRVSEVDDQAAQLFLAFSNRNAILYLWDTTAPEGSTGEAWAPPFMTIKAMVLRSGHRDSGKWVLERRNVIEDYRSLYGEEPPQVAGVRIQINSQHTNSSGESFFADVVFGRH
jgi:hypothetical protein